MALSALPQCCVDTELALRWRTAALAHGGCALAQTARYHPGGSQGGHVRTAHIYPFLSTCGHTHTHGARLSPASAGHGASVRPLGHGAPRLLVVRDAREVGRGLRHRARLHQAPARKGAIRTRRQPWRLTTMCGRVHRVSCTEISRAGHAVPSVRRSSMASRQSSRWLPLGLYGAYGGTRRAVTPQRAGERRCDQLGVRS